MSGIYIVKFPSTITGGKTITTNSPITVNLGTGQNFLDADGGYKSAPCSTPVLATITGASSVCAGSTTTLTATGGNTYKWSNGATTASITVGAGTYTVTVTNTEGCTGVATQTVTTTATFVTFTNCPNNIVLQLNSPSGTCAPVNWTAPTATSNCGTPTVTSNYKPGNCLPFGTTTVTYTAKLNGITATCSFTVTIKLPSYGSIGDLVFCDNNNNSIFDNGDTPISGVSIFLCNVYNQVITSTITSASGSYLFPNLNADTYVVKFPSTLPDGKNITTTNLITVNLAPNQKYVDADAGYYKPAAAVGSIGDFTFNDNNGNGVYDTGDTPKSSILVTLCNSAGQTISTTLSVSGLYSFGNLAAGTYIVKFPATHTDGKTLTTPQQITVNLAAGQNFVNADAGYNFPTSPVGSIGDFVFCDNNNNHVYDSGDTPLSNVVVTLCNSSNVVITTATTNTSGNYSFGSLVAGTYIVKFPATLADGKAITTTNPITVNLTAGQNVTSADAGYYKSTTVNCNATRDNTIIRTCSNNIPVLTGTALAGYEYQWLSSTSVCPNTPAQAIAGATGQNYSLPSNVSQTTYFMRCARPIGCTTWDAVTESNCLTVNASDCTPSGTKCDVVIVKGNTNGTISVTGLGTYTSFVQVFNSLWQTVSNQEYNQSSVSITVKNGTYSVKVLLYDASNGAWIYLCEKNVSVTVTGGVNALSKNITLDINAFAEAQRAQIQWINNTGSQNDFFTVEKLNPVSGTFEKIETVNSKPTEVNEAYSIYDNAITEGDNTYRVQLTMLDGQVKTSALKTVTYKNLNDIRIFPNPASDYIDVDLKQYEGKKVSLYIYNQVGKLVQTQQIERASATPIHLDMDKQASGQMLIRVTAEGRREVTKKFVIQN